MDSIENNDVKMGELIFIRNGKVFRKKFPYEEGKNFFPEEETLLMQSFGVSKEEFEKIDLTDRYSALTESGWTIIRNIGEYPFQNSIFIGSQITQADYEEVMKILGSEEEPVEISPERVYNRTNFKYGRQFEAVAVRDVTSTEIVDIFMRDKLGQTTEYEKEMLGHFRTFDLERILTGADSSYRINNGSGGVIVITPDEFLTNPCSGIYGQHGSAVSDILNNKFHKLYRDNKDYNFIFGPDIFKCEMIQCSNMGEEGEVIVWTPSEMNEFQYKKLIELQDTLEQIKQRTGKNIDVSHSLVTRQAHSDERSDTPNNYKEFLLKNHDLIVNNYKDYNIEKSSMPEYRMITENELCDCLGIEIPKPKDVGQDVKGQLFDKAKQGLSLLSSNIMGLFREKSTEKEI